MSEIIGAVSIKVMPDTKGFRKAAKAQLKVIEETLDDIEIKFKADFKDAVKDAAAARKAMEQAAKKSIRIKFDFDNAEQVKGQLAKVDKELQRFRKYDVNLKVKLNEAELREARDLLAEHNDEIWDDFRERVLERINDGMKGVKLKPDIDQRAFRNKIDDLYSSLEEKEMLQVKPNLSAEEKFRLEREISNIEAEIQAVIGEASRRYAQFQLRWLGRTRTVSFVPVVNAAAAAKVSGILAGITGGRILTNTFAGFKNFLTDLDKAVPKIMAWTNVLTNLFAGVTAFLSNTVTSLMDIARIAGAGLALPGILGGLAIGLASTVNAFADWNDVFPTFKKNWNDMREQMSDAFWKEAAEPFRELAKSLFPQFLKNIVKTNTALGGFFGNLAKSLDKVFDNQLDNMFKDLNRSIQIFGKYTTNVASVLKQLGDVGAGNLPRLARWFGEVTKEFDEWLKKKGPDGLQRYIDRGIDRLKDLGTVIKQSGRLFNALSVAAEKAGGSTLKSMADTVTRAANAAKKADFQKNLTTALKGAHDAMGNIAKESGPAFKRAMVTLANLMGDSMPVAGEAFGTTLRGMFDAFSGTKIQASIRGFFDNILASAQNLEPAWRDLAEAFSVVLDVMGNMGRVASGVLAPIFSSINAVIQPIASAIKLIPGPLRDMIMVVGIATVGFLALMRQIQAAKLALQAFATQAMATNTVMGRMNSKIGMAAGVAGVGGMVALQQGAERSSDALTVLGNVGTGAAMGAMIGSVFPGLGTAIGGAVGAAGGLATGILSVKRASDEGKPSIENLKVGIDDYTQALIASRGAADEQVRSLVALSLEQSGVSAKAREMGITQRDLIDAALGNKTGIDQVTAAYEANKGKVDELTSVPVSKWIEDQSIKLADARGKWQENFLQVKSTKELMQKLPKDVRVAIRAHNAEPTKKSLKEIEEKTDKLSKFKKRIVLELINDGDIKGRTDDVKKSLEGVGRVKPDMKQFIAGIDSRTQESKDIARGAKKDIDRIIKGYGDVKPDMPGLHAGMSENLSTAKSTASSGGFGIGDALKAGMLAGFAGTAAALSAAASGAVNGALAGARAAGLIRSPSRKMKEVGHWLGMGGIVGLTATIPLAAKAASTYARTIIANVKRGFDVRFNLGLEKRFERLTGSATKVLDKSAKATQKAEERLAALRSKYESAKSKAAKKNATAAQRRAAANLRRQVIAQRKTLAKTRKYERQMTSMVEKSMKRLEEIRSKYEEAVQRFEDVKAEAAQYRTGIVDSIIAFGDPSGLKTFGGVIRMMQDARNKAMRFGEAIKKLANAGLNDHTLQQLVSAGPESALATAEAILAAGGAGVTQVNDLMKDIVKAGNGLGDTMVDVVYSDTLKELSNAIKPLEKDLRKLTDKLLAQMEKQASKSVPKVTKQFRKLGDEIRRTVKALERMAIAEAEAKPASNLANRSNRGVLAVGGGSKTINYYAASGSSLGEDDLFNAMDRARGLW